MKTLKQFFYLVKPFGGSALPFLLATACRLTGANPVIGLVQCQNEHVER